ncbi:MAG: o-succinylbenzoate synthase [Acidimicrobiia bacterium]|nr:o-succinylbenzoate synthase [Acidimicrobiia bacterium]
MKVEELELRRIVLPLVTPFRTSFGVQNERDVLLVRARVDGVDGWGECVAGMVPNYSSEFTEGAHLVTRQHLAPALLAAADVTAATVRPLLDGTRGHPMAKAALEAAVLDAELRQSGVSLAQHLGAVTDSVEVGVSVGITGSVGDLVGRVALHVDEGYGRVKVKIEPGFDVEPVAAVRARFGDLRLQVDANAAYTRADGHQLRRLDDFDLLLIEQPLAEDDLLGHARLAEELRTPICLDESITSARVAADAVALGACSIVNIKAGRVGGYLEARRIHDLCRAADVPVWCGGMLETGIGRAANLALAALPGFLLPGDISASDRYFATDITEPFVLDGGRLPVPSGPGIGVEPIPDVLDAVTTGSELLR